MGAGCCKEDEIDFDGEVDLMHFDLLRSVGKGAFGKVRVVQHKKDQKVYALKYINKAKCMKMKAVDNIIQERRLLEEIEFPLVCNLRFAFQDDENMFMILDLMLGGDLRFHLERQGCMSESMVKFYVAEVGLALDYLHSKHIVHRDLKPDNVLLDERGHAHLTDFNIAVHFRPSKPLTSVAGSMAYMAPEILAKKGYFDTVDWWSLGVMAYELLLGKRPFRAKTNDALTQSILHDEPPFPDNVEKHISKTGITGLKQLLEKDCRKRLGCASNSPDDFKGHPWLAGLPWDGMPTKECQTPFVPDSKKPNFDATHELEELLLEENPLKHKKRSQPKPGQPQPHLSREARKMNQEFLSYDYSKPRRQSQFERSFTDLKNVKDETTSKVSSQTAAGIGAQTTDRTGAASQAPVSSVDLKHAAKDGEGQEPGMAAKQNEQLQQPVPQITTSLVSGSEGHFLSTSFCANGG